MFYKSCLALVISAFLFLFSAVPSFAIENPLATANNKVGIHVFFPSEIQEAAKLVNSDGGDWGYVTVPYLANDHDLPKWQDFMYQCKKNHIIPIVRISTYNDPNNTAVWKKPDLTDVINSANFLDQLNWPTKNRYVIIYNEVNRGDEWGGNANPSEYAHILSFAVTAFKAKSPDYFIISSGMDNAAPSQGTTYMNDFDYMRQMNQAVPAIFNQVDGLASHSYPNPGFSQAPNDQTQMGVATFKYERDLAKQMTGKDLPVFITETGWTADKISNDTQVQYYKQTFDTIWNDPGVVAVTPFVLDARGGPFQQFSFKTATGDPTPVYNFVMNLSKTKGVPTIPVVAIKPKIKVLAAETKKSAMQQPTKENTKPGFSVSDVVKKMFGWLNV